jgi:hypothetical protein
MTNRISKHQQLSGCPMTWVRVSDMIINDRCQQPLKKAFARHILSNLDLSVLGHLTVNILTDSNKAEVLDGQTRMWALLRYGHENMYVLCDTYYDLPDAEKALKFVALNDKKNPSLFHKFVKAVIGGREREVSINRIVERHGMRISESTDGNSIAAVAAVGRVYDQCGGSALAQSISTLHAAYPNDHLGLSGLLIEAVGKIYARYGESLVADRLIDVLATEKRGHVTFYQSAELERAVNNGTKLNCLSSVITVAYNKSFGLAKKGRLPRWWNDPRAKKASDAKK